MLRGESLIKKDIKTIIDYIALEKEIKCSISTNRSLLKNRIEDTKNVSSINIGLDGNEDQHNRNRGQRSYKKIIQAIDIACRRNFISITKISRKLG